MSSTSVAASSISPQGLLVLALLTLAWPATAQTTTPGSGSLPDALIQQDQHPASATASVSATVSLSTPQGGRPKSAAPPRLFQPDLAAMADPYATDAMADQRPPTFDPRHPMLAAPADASGDMIGKRRLQDSASSVPRDPWLPADADPDFARSAPRP